MDAQRLALGQVKNYVPKLAPGGYAIIDDYQVVPGCRQAVDDFRSQHGIVEPIRQIDWAGVYWRREDLL